MKIFTCIYFDVLMVFSIVLRHHLQKIEITSKRIGNYLEFMLFVVLHAFCGTKISFERWTPKIVIL